MTKTNVKSETVRVRFCDTPEARAERLWEEKYLPVERDIIAAYERRQELRASRREREARAFGDLCEATGGQAVLWRRNGWAWDDIALPINSDAWTRKCADRYFAIARIAPDATQHLAPLVGMLIKSLIMLPFFATDAKLFLTILSMIITQSSELANSLKRRSHRPLYYERETERRRSLASERRRVVKRRTLSRCPTREEVLDAWLHRKDSKEAALRFGSMIEDLECYVDNSLRFAGGRISGREAGVKGWLSDNIPALTYKYSTIMRYKAAAKKLKQVTGLEDPLPIAAVLPEQSGETGIENTETRGREVLPIGGTDGIFAALGREERARFETRIVRAAAIWKEVAEGNDSFSKVMGRLDALLDPKRVEDANMLAEWKAKYENEITVRNKSRWWARLWKNGGKGKG